MTTKDARRASGAIQAGCVALLGIPLDENSSYLRGCALGPARVREVIASGSSNLCAEDGTDVGSDPRFVDVGDVELTTGATSIAAIEAAADGFSLRGVACCPWGRPLGVPIRWSGPTPATIPA